MPVIQIILCFNTIKRAETELQTNFPAVELMIWALETRHCTNLPAIIAIVGLARIQTDLQAGTIKKIEQESFAQAARIITTLL